MAYKEEWERDVAAQRALEKQEQEVRLRERKKAEREEAKEARKIERIETQEATERAAIPGAIARGIGTGFRGAIRKVTGISPGVALPRGIVHPDSLIKRKELYLGQNTKTTPLGGMRSGGWKELYFPSQKLPFEAEAVLGAIHAGFTEQDQIEVVTGLNSAQINKGLMYLKSKNLIPELSE